MKLDFHKSEQSPPQTTTQAVVISATCVDPMECPLLQQIQNQILQTQNVPESESWDFSAMTISCNI